jgi:hypothetical protein
MKTRTLLGALCVMAAVASVAWAQRPTPPARPAAAVGGQSVSCDSSQYKSEEALERRALRTALRGARRVSAHDLTVNVASGVRRFTDRKPYREELSGFHWLYCGYVPALHAHLIGVFDEDRFSGKLLLDVSGNVVDAGRTIYPSPNGKLFLGANQTNGNALEDWVLSDLAGRRLWAGPSGSTGSPDTPPVAYENPRWISDDAIRVTAVCGDPSGTKGEATLVRAGRSWRWRRKLQCKS